MKNTLWIARDEDESLCLYNDRPIKVDFKGQQKFMPNWYKDSFFECINPEPINHFILKIDSKLFSELTFENSPQQVKLTLANNNEK